MDATRTPPSTIYMKQMEGSPCTGNHASNMIEILQALRDIQSIDIDNLKAQFLKGSEPINQKVADNLMQKTSHSLETLKRETKTIQKRLEEEQNFKKEYVSVFGKRKINDLHKKMEELNGVKEKLKDEIKRLKEKNRNLEEETQKVLEENSDAFRLSKHMRDLNIDDLNDQNRLSKLAERYTDLYDNQWTCAFEALTEMRGKQEERAIEILFNLLIECHNFAKMAAEKQMDDFLTLVCGGPQMQLGDEIKMHMMKARKLADVTRADLLFQKCERHIKDRDESISRYLDEKEMKKYLIECFQICWLMAIQDPPVVLGKEVKNSDTFDTSMYKHYTRSGTRVKYVVWPPLLLYEGGPLLAKGIAHTIQEKTNTIANSKWKEHRCAWEEGDSTRIKEKSRCGRIKQDAVELSLMTKKTVKNDWQDNAHRPKTKRSSPSSDVPTSHLYWMADVNRQLTTDHSSNTEANNGKDLFSNSCKHSNDGGYNVLHSNILSLHGTSTNYALESENKSALRPQVSIPCTGQSYAKSSKTQSTQSPEVISSHTSSRYADDITSKRCDFLVKLANETQDHLWSTEQRSKPEHCQKRVPNHGYEPLKRHEQSNFDCFIRKYKKEGKWVTQKYFPNEYNRYIALYREMKQTGTGKIS
ncbi:hypothetical protein CHS0354_026350 [Potamilus streckersoni]|uniref:Mitochondria-eating protein C-terminal domain-containing protein n=1 Tax=Potamilus streckersoni TaxID=2493646 RepID=A0AAE0T3V3_9BIVA|nr:hypothetical protein CHS0354_026350 [Potamilus streckersoni]